MKKFLIGVFVVVLLLAGLVFFRGEAMALSYMAGKTEKRSVAELSDLLRPHMTIYEPSTEVLEAGPVRLLVQMHGCGGLNLDHHGRYADMATAAGFVVVVVSSNEPRGFDAEGSRTQVCQGKALLGQERAGDIVVAIGYASEKYDVDTDEIVLAGWSHGAWSVMDYLSMDMERQVPASLSAYEGEVPDIKGAVLFYPYCGIGSRARVHGWKKQAPDVLTLMGTADSVVDTTQCQVVFSKLELDMGKRVETRLYEGAEHAFDHAFLPEGISHWFDPEPAADAWAAYEEFVQSMAR